MDISVQVTGLAEILQGFSDANTGLVNEVSKGLYASGLQIEGEAKKSILGGEKTGHVYTRRSVSHQASAPGEAPASDTGDLVNKINTQLTSPVEVTVSAASAHALPLEVGTSKMAPRPFMFPAAETSVQWIIDRMTQAVQLGISRGK